MLQSVSVLEKSNSVERLSLDNYRVPSDTLTDIAREYLLENPNVSGVLITEDNQVIGSIARRALFEKLSKEFSHALYATKPIWVILNSFKEEVLKVSANTLITDAVKLCFSRPAKLTYDPIIVVKDGQELGMLDFSKLILAQSEMFFILNEKLTQQEQELRSSAERLEEQGQNIQQYAVELEIQQQNLQQRNTLLEDQKAQLRDQTEELSSKITELSQKTEEISNLNKRFEEVGVLLSKEGKRTLDDLRYGVETVIQFTQKINIISDDFQEKLAIINQGNDLINTISKRVENLSFQASILGAKLPKNDNIKIPFNMIIEEIEKLSVQIFEANTTSNKISKAIRSQIHTLVKTAKENQEVVTTLSQNSQKTEMALASLAQLLIRD